MKRVIQLVVLLVPALAGVVIASPASATSYPLDRVTLLWLSDDDPSTVGHQAALNISVSDLSNVDGTFYVYEGATVPQSGNGIAQLAVDGASAQELFTTTTNVGAASRFSVKFVSNNASFSDTNFQNIRLTCSAGTYSDSGFGPCLKAPAGHYVEYQGSTGFQPCTPGRYQTDAGKMYCMLAPLGTYVSEFGATSANLCPLGTYASNSGSISCNSTPAGAYASEEGSTEATSCAPGTYQPQTGQTGCIDAPAGTYVADTAALSPTQCPDGHFNANARATSRDTCVAATAGSYVATSDRTKKQSCTKGSFQPGRGQTSCIAAELGFFVNTDGASSQTKCRRGTTTDVVGSTSCKLSPKVPKLPTSLSHTRISTVYLNAGKNTNGLRVTLSSRAKTCRIQKDPSGYKLAGLKTGRCLITLNIKGNSRFASITVTRNIRVL